MSDRFTPETEEAAEFARHAEAPEPGLLREILDLVRENGKWWMLPILAALLVMGALLVLGQTAVAPFIYTLF